MFIILTSNNPYNIYYLTIINNLHKEYKKTKIIGQKLDWLNEKNRINEIEKKF